MKRIMVAVLAGLLTATIGAAPVWADQSQLSVILFGKIYNDNVTAHQVGASLHDEGGIPISVLYPSRARMIASQAEATQDAGLRQALALRHIAVKNVIWIQTAANGGKVVYYR